MKSNDILHSTIERCLSELPLAQSPERLYEPIGYTLSAGGKRIRPMLLLLSCNLFCRDISHALPAAAAVEVFHNFTLLHDDIMDNAPLRRSKPTVHAHWGQNVAILSGDVMMILAYRLLSKLPAEYLPAVLERFNHFATLVCEGQQYDMDFEARQSVSLEEYMRMIELKTSVLLGGAAVIGAILGGATNEYCEQLERFATELGLAFQLQDDLLDSYGDEELGKSIGGDILEGKKTYLMITALERGDETTRCRLKGIYRDSSLNSDEKIREVKSIYDSLGVPQLTQRLIDEKFDVALSILDGMDVDESAKSALRAFAQTLVNRKK